MKNDGVPTEGRVLGIDYGSVRIGLSISDPLRILAQEYDTIKNTDQAVRAIKDIVAREHITLVVIGIPLTLKGERGHKAKEVDRFVELLKKTIDTHIVPWDERFTSKLAQQTLLQMGTRKMQRRTRKDKVDSMAAAILLQSFLDSSKNSLVC